MKETSGEKAQLKGLSGSGYYIYTSSPYYYYYFSITPQNYKMKFEHMIKMSKGDRRKCGWKSKESMSKVLIIFSNCLNIAFHPMHPIGASVIHINVAKNKQH